MSKIINNTITNLKKTKKLYFSFEYFDYENFDINISNNFSEWKSFMKKISELTEQNIIDVIKNNQIKLTKLL